jgi:trk system potassium uptake protein
MADRFQQWQQQPLVPAGWRPFCLTALSVGPLNGLLYLFLADPAGAFGAYDEMTQAGIALTGILTLGALLACLMTRRRPERARVYAMLLAGLAAVPFVASASEDLLVRPVGVLLNLWLAHRCLLGCAPERSAHDRRPLFNTLVLFLVLALVGHKLASHWWAGLCLSALSLLAWAEARYVLATSRRFLERRTAFSLALLALPPLVLALPLLGATAIAVLELLLLGAMARQADLIGSLLESLYKHPAQMFAVSFGAIILLGTVLLTLPGASAHATPVGLIDALFTATSATCVTGLIVLDTPKDFSVFGQAVILLLIQVGGLGMITLSSFVSLLLGRRVGLKAEAALSQLYEADRAAMLFDLIRFIVVVTLAIEGMGALLLAHVFLQRGHGLGESIWLGCFHSISAFCNAGFALFSDSLVGLQGSFLALGTVCCLIVLGGIGFGVLSIGWLWMRAPGDVPRFPVHVRMTVRGTIVLIVVGTLLVLGLEWSSSLAGLSTFERLANALFQSITCRTAGFNTVDFTRLSQATIFVMILLMFVGAGSNSTGGGIKVTTAMVMYSAVASVLRGRSEVEVLGRTLPRATVYKTAVIITLALAFISAGTLVLLATQQGPFAWIVFEAFSACATVGLSLGMTAELDSIGKLVIIVLMFVGRIGPLTLLLVLESRTQRSYRLPEASILVG